MHRKKVDHENSKHDYDSLNDTFYAYELNQEYMSSLIFGGIIMDMNEDKEFIGIEILNASENFDVSSYEFITPITLKVHYLITDEEVKLDVMFTFVKRNQSIVRRISATGANDMNLAPVSATLALA